MYCAFSSSCRRGALADAGTEHDLTPDNLEVNDVDEVA
jgi:hypothetical protein